MVPCIGRESTCGTTQPAMIEGYMKLNGVPAVELLLYASAIIEIVGGLLILVGFRARAGALLLFLWLIPVTIMMHAIPGGRLNQVEVLKNLAIMGGLLILATQGPGAYSVDRD